MVSGCEHIDLTLILTKTEQKADQSTGIEKEPNVVDVLELLLLADASSKLLKVWWMIAKEEKNDGKTSGDSVEPVNPSTSFISIA